MISRQRHLQFVGPILLIQACTEPQNEPGGSDTSKPGPDTHSVTDTVFEEAHPLGEPVPGFALIDINPSSSSYDQVVDSSNFEGTAYSIIFLDSRCITCIEVIEDMWVELESNPSWKEGLPLYAIQSIGGGETQDKTLDRMIAGHDMPYLQDTEDAGLWWAYEALNHDFFAVSEVGTLDMWLPLYVWPDDLSLYLDYMSQRFGS